MTHNAPSETLNLTQLNVFYTALIANSWSVCHCVYVLDVNQDFARLHEIADEKCKYHNVYFHSFE